MRFDGDIFGDKKPMYTAQEQTSLFACHQWQNRERLWAHDVHAIECLVQLPHYTKDDAMKVFNRKSWNFGATAADKTQTDKEAQSKRSNEQKDK